MNHLSNQIKTKIINKNNKYKDKNNYQLNISWIKCNNILIMKGNLLKLKNINNNKSRKVKYHLTNYKIMNLIKINTKK